MRAHRFGYHIHRRVSCNDQAMKPIAIIAFGVENFQEPYYLHLAALTVVLVIVMMTSDHFTQKHRAGSPGARSIIVSE